MTTTQIYLFSLQQDLRETGHFNHLPFTPTEILPLMLKAKELAGGTGKTATTGNTTLSIFSFLANKKQPSPKHYYPLDEISLTKDFFPKQTPKVSTTFWQSFTHEYDEVCKIHSANDKVLAETLLFTLHKYGTVLPSCVGEEISLYDYARMKASIAICLSHFDMNDLPEKPLLMVGGDVGGIQDYIYDIVSKNASKNLKGRSYFIQLLVDTILHKVLKDLDLYQTNIVFGSGGKFFLLAPNIDAVKTKLETIELAISKSLFTQFKTTLTLFLSSQELSLKTLLEDKNIGTYWKRLYASLNKKKRQKFSFLFNDLENNFFDPSELGGLQVRDTITNEEIGRDDETFIIKGAIPKIATAIEIEAGINLLSRTSYEQIMLGFLLKSEMYRISGDEDIDIQLPASDIYRDNRKYTPLSIGVSHYILNDNKFTINSLKPTPDHILTVNDYSFLKKSSTSLIHGFEYYGGNDYPKIDVMDGSYQLTVSKTFSEMAGMSEEERDYVVPFQETKFKRFGVLRMDVDGLGNVFSSVFEGYGSLSHYASLSRHMDWFFKGYLNTIWNETTERRENTQIIYSGGDDLFLVGKWDLIIEFAERIREDFTAWTCNNPQLSISGGIAVVTAKFPISKSAIMAGDAEDKAKDYIFDGKQKNSITIFGETLNWDIEYKITKDLKDTICRLSQMNSKPLPTTFIYKINGFYEIANRQNNLTWRWQMAYDLKRLTERSKGNNAVVDFLEEIIKWSMTHIIPPSVSAAFTEDLRTKKINFFKLLNLAAIWASYELRN
jgi:CRISPR-associated protein Csm1